MEGIVLLCCVLIDVRSAVVLQVAYATATEEMVQIRKCFTTVGLMARVLAGKRRAPIPALQTWVRHAYIKAVTSQVLGMAKGLKGPNTKEW